MFTGIIREVGSVRSIARRGGVLTFAIEAPELSAELLPGDSLAINGVCQTVIKVDGAVVYFESVPETLRRTNLKMLKHGSEVNLEPALRVGDRVSGHFVSGHIDGTGIVRSKDMRAHRNVDFAIQVPDEITKFIHSKGSICLDGVSLTVNSIKGSIVGVTIVPFTLARTTLKNWRVGSLVNVEVDMLARYLSPRQH